MSRVYIPSAGRFGTVTGKHTSGFLHATTYLHVRCDDGEAVQVLLSDTVPAERALILTSGNVVPFPTHTIRHIPIRTPDGDGPRAA